MIETKHIMISGILEEMISENHPFKIRLNDQEFSYYTRFYNYPTMMKDIHDGKHLLIDPIDPPIGNIKIIQSNKVTLESFTSSYLVKASVQFLSRQERNVIKLSYPKALDIEKQKRTDIRVPIDPSWGVIVKVIYPAGMSFLGPVINLSKNGICFVCQTPIANIDKLPSMKLIVIWEDKKMKAQGDAEILSYHIQEGGVYYYARFWFESSADVRSVQKMLSSLQKNYQAKRAALFGL